MNITLVDSACFPSSWMGTFLALPPLGLLSLASSVQDVVDKITVLDDKLPSRKLLENTDILGVRAMTHNAPYALAFLREAKQINPDIKTVIGGYYPTITPERVNKEFIDHIALGEGEISFRKIVLGETAEKFVESPLIENLDDLPFPAYHLIQDRLSKYHLCGIRTVMLETSRGCPYSKCTFCTVKEFHRHKFRQKSVSRVIEEISRYSNRNSINFVDDNHTANVKWSLALCDAIIEYGYDDILYTCTARVDTLAKHPELVKRLADAGYFSFFIGVESPYQSTLDNIQKGVTWEQTKQAIKLLNDYGMSSYVSLIIGTPNETEEMVRNHPKYIQELKSSLPHFAILCYTPNTPIYEEMKDDNLILINDLQYYDGTVCTFKHPNIDPRRLNQLCLDIHKKYYSNLKNYLPLFHNLLQIARRMLPRRVKKRVSNYLSSLKEFNLLQSSRVILQNLFDTINDVRDAGRFIESFLNIVQGKTLVSQEYVDNINKKLDGLLGEV